MAITAALGLLLAVPTTAGASAAKCKTHTVTVANGVAQKINLRCSIRGRYHKLSARITKKPRHGKLRLASSHRYAKYTPKKGFNGKDRFRYTVRFRHRKYVAAMNVQVRVATTRITTSPPLTPSFDPGIFDYTLRCNGQPVTVTARTPKGATVRIDGRGSSKPTTKRTVPLRENQGFTWSVRASAHGAVIVYHARCAPSRLPVWATTKTGTPQAQWYIIANMLGITSGFVTIVDTNGVPVWWISTGPSPMDAKLIGGNTVVWAHLSGNFNNAQHEFHSLNGQSVGPDFSALAASPHDVQPAADGNYYLIRYVPRNGVDLTAYGGPASATVVDGEIDEVNAQGQVLWSWNTKDHVTLDESAYWLNNGGLITNPMTLPDGSKAYDLVHMNSIDLNGNNVVFSARHLDAVYSVDRSTGNINWKLGGSATPESLTVLNDPLGGNFGGQHDARVLPDGSVTLHDGGTLVGRGPRGVRYQIDAVDRTATMVEQIVDGRVNTSFCCGSVTRLSGGDWVAAWGANPFVTELDPSGRPVFTLTYAGVGFSYRVDAVEPGRVSAEALRAGMDAQWPR